MNNPVEALMIWGFGQPYSSFSYAAWTLAKVLAIVVPITLCVAFLTLWERKVIGWMQVRIGPNRVGFGWLQPFADVLKLLLKEIIVPTGANKTLFYIAPLLSIGPALAAWAVIPFDPTLVLANVNAGLLYILALTSVGVYGVILAGWASNSKYAFIGCMRSAAQIVSYEIAMGFALVGVLMAANSLNLSDIVNAQQGGVHQWYFIPLFPLFIVYFISGVAETNRHPFDVAEGESEIVAGFHVEYGGFKMLLFFIGEYGHMMVASGLMVTFFFGGWQLPLISYDQVYQTVLDVISSPSGASFLTALIHFLAWNVKFALFLWIFIQVRWTLPRFRYDQLMDLGWKTMLPWALANTILTAIVIFIAHS